MSENVKAIETKDGLILDVLAKPRSQTAKIVVERDEVIIFCREEPAKGKANKEIVKMLSRLFHRRVELLSGFSSRQKKLLIRDAKKGDFERVIRSGTA